jgi:putative DNA primase/helicase
MTYENSGSSDPHLNCQTCSSEWDYIDQFRDSIRAAGLEPPMEIPPGKLIRFPTNGKPGDTAGWCKLFEDGRGGVFGDHRLGINESWHARRLMPGTRAEREAFKRQCEQAERERQQEQALLHDEAAQLAAAILNSGNGDPTTHPYQLEKIVTFGPGVKRGMWPQRGWIDALLVPILGADSNIWSVEAINTDGRKDFLKHGKKRGGFYAIGALRGAKIILVGEGVATVAAAAHATGLPAVAALDCGNLEAAARSIKQIEPKAELIFLADNDLKPDGSNPGLNAATEVARSLRARLAVPRA